MTSWSFTIARPMPSKNDRLVNSGSNAQRGRYVRLRAAWCADLHNAMWIAGVPKATGPRRVTLTRLYGKGQRRLDDDGPDPKIILDAAKATIGHKRIGLHRIALHGAALIVDDRPGMMALGEIAQERSEDGRPGVRVLVEDGDTNAPAEPGRSEI